MSDDTPGTGAPGTGAPGTGGDAESPSNETTEPIDPARPAEDDAPDSAQPPNGGAPARSDGAGVSIPSWLAGALVVVLALLIAGAGFAIGRATAPDDGGGFRPIVATEGGRGGGPRTFPIPGGPGGQPGVPDGEGRRGDGPRVFPGWPDHEHDESQGDEGDERRDRDDSDDDSGSPTPPELPGT